MSWNYRTVRCTESDAVFYEIKEVYYNEQGLPNGYCDADLFGETLEELKDVFDMMKLALEKPILDDRTDFSNGL